jgi:hypothetical protein
VKLIARGRARKKLRNNGSGWERDHSTRAASQSEWLVLPQPAASLAD